MNTNRQKLLPFEGDKETKRIERIERILGKDRRITTADKLPFFDYAEATKLAEQSNAKAAARER